MSVAVLCGSDRVESFNAVVSAALTSMLTASGAVVESVDTGAEIPRFRPELVDVLPPVVADIRTTFAAADGVAFVVPEYAGGPPGWVKNLADWMVGSASLYQRPVVVASAATGGGSHAIRQLARTLTWQGALVVATCSIAGPSTKIHARSIVDSRTIDDVATHHRRDQATRQPLKGIVAILENAQPEDRKAVDRELSLAVVYHDNERMQVTAGPDACTNECVGGAIVRSSPRHHRRRVRPLTLQALTSASRRSVPDHLTRPDPPVERRH